MSSEEIVMSEERMKELYVEFLTTLTLGKDEWYSSERSLAEHFLDRFFDYIKDEE
jgi:hypothetical protein